MFVQEGDLQGSVPSSFSDALTAYLNKTDAGYSLVLLCLLRDFISSLRCHDASFKGKNPFGHSSSRFICWHTPPNARHFFPGEVWWNPEKLDTNTCCYLGLTCRLFSVIISGAGEGPAAASFRDLMKLLIQVGLTSC